MQNSALRTHFGAIAVLACLALSGCSSDEDQRAAMRLEASRIQEEIERHRADVAEGERRATDNEQKIAHDQLLKTNLSVVNQQLWRQFWEKSLWNMFLVLLLLSPFAVLMMVLTIFKQRYLKSREHAHQLEMQQRRLDSERRAALEARVYDDWIQGRITSADVKKILFLPSPVANDDAPAATCDVEFSEVSEDGAPRELHAKEIKDRFVRVPKSYLAMCCAFLGLLALSFGGFWALQSATSRAKIDQYASIVGKNTQAITSEYLGFSTTVNWKGEPIADPYVVISAALSVEISELLSPQPMLESEDASGSVGGEKDHLFLLDNSEVWEERVNRYVRWMDACFEYLKFAHEHGQVNTVDGCSISMSTALPEDWRAAFDTRAPMGYRLGYDLESESFRVQTRSLQLLEVCNLAPYESDFFVISDTHDKESQVIYQELLEDPAEYSTFQRMGTLQAGACAGHLITTVLDEPGVWVASSSLKPELVSWLRDEMSILDSYTQARTYDWYDLGDQIDCNRVGEGAEQFVRDSCSENAELMYLPAHRPHGQVGADFRFLAIEPTFDYMVSDWATLSAGELSEQKQQTSGDADFIEARYRNYRRWLDALPTANLGAAISDPQGALIHGVWVENLPRATVWNEVIDLPETGLLIQFGEHEIFSVHDLYAAVNEHARDRETGGLHVPVYLVMKDSSSLATVGYENAPEIGGTTRLLADINVAQPYSVPTVGPLAMGAGRGTIIGAYRAFCAIVSLGEASTYSYTDNCTWNLNQQVAWALQEDAFRFRIGESVAPIIPLGKLSSSLISVLRAGKVVKGSRIRAVYSGHVLRMGVFEASIDAGYELALEPPGTPFVERLAEGPSAFGYGFMIGMASEVAFPPGSKRSNTRKG